MSHEPVDAPPLEMLSCPVCKAEIAPGLLSCPVCHRLVYADRLKELAQAAEKAEDEGEPSSALACWREALSLLPSQTRQFAVIVERIAKLGQQVDSVPSEAAARAPSSTRESSTAANAPSHTGWSKGAATGALGTLALAVWKFKFLALMVLSKAKLLLLGLTKASTFLTMFAAVGVYWTRFGFWFALGFVLSIYVHEMGHVAALTRYGVRATAPLFIPGLGAVIRLKQEFTDPRQDARVALAGPIWGLGAALFCAIAFALSRQPIWAALAQFGALINLFNLIPIWQLDGGRVFRSLNRPQRWLAVTALATAWAITEDGLLMLLMIVGAGRTVFDKPCDRPDRGALTQYIGLVAALSLMAYSPHLRIP
jgi:Zn-dependent protease